MNDPIELSKFLAREQNTLDHLTRAMYGSNVKFDHLSAFGQYTIEAMARERVLASDPDPELRSARAQIIDLERENQFLTKKLAAALRDNEDLWSENEEYKMKEYDDAEEISHRGSTRRREIRSEDNPQEFLE